MPQNDNAVYVDIRKIDGFDHLVLSRMGFWGLKVVHSSPLYLEVVNFIDKTGKSKGDADFYTSLIDWWVPKTLQWLEKKEEILFRYSHYPELQGCNRVSF